jgi:hypothetical protein
MRTNVRERLYRFFTGQQVDRCPDQEFGYWPQTIRMQYIEKKRRLIGR